MLLLLANPGSCLLLHGWAMLTLALGSSCGSGSWLLHWFMQHDGICYTSVTNPELLLARAVLAEPLFS